VIDPPSTIDRIETVWMRGCMIFMTVVGAGVEIALPICIWMLVSETNKPLALGLSVLAALIFWPAAFFLLHSFRRVYAKIQ
jgi:uncharacterized membrane protein YhfC